MYNKKIIKSEANVSTKNLSFFIVYSALLTWWQRIGDSSLVDGQRIIKHSQGTHDDGDFSIYNRSRSVFD